MVAHEAGRCEAGNNGLPPRSALCHNRAILTETEIALNGSAAELERLATAISDFCRAHALDDDVEFDLNLVLEALFTNSVRHGGCAGVADAVRIRLRAAAEGVELEYLDRGVPFNPLNAAPPDLAAPLLDRPDGGLGVHLVRQIMRDLRYRRVTEGNELKMIRRMEPK
jgi:serine/threonine-protein kinase RsbW